MIFFLKSLYLCEYTSLTLSILTQMLGEVRGASSYMFFHNLQSNENQRNITLSEQFQNSIEIL